MNWVCRRPWPAFAAPLPESKQGLRYECDVRNVIAREVDFTGRYEPQETCLVRHLLGPGQTFVDVGAHRGYFSLMAAECVGPGGRVVAIEADPRMYGILARSIALNRLPQVTTRHLAVAAESGTVPFLATDERDRNWGLARIAPDAAGGRAVSVPAESLDGMQLGQVDLLKVDIEGAEIFALRGMREGLERGLYRRILLELHAEQLASFGSSGAEVAAILGGAGYTALTVEHSAAATRRASYSRNLRPGDLLRPFDPAAPLDAWAHQLWSAPGMPPPVAPEAASGPALARS
jgi:FkbM family methyltransferase